MSIDPVGSVEPPFEPTRCDKEVKHDAAVKPPKPEKDETPDWPGCTWRHVPAASRVRYCPGGAPGLPRWASRRLVDRWRADDERYLAAVRPFSAEAAPPPHEGRCPLACPHWTRELGLEPSHATEPVPAAEAAEDRRRQLLGPRLIANAPAGAARAPAREATFSFSE